MHFVINRQQNVRHHDITDDIAEGSVEPIIPKATNFQFPERFPMKKLSLLLPLLVSQDISIKSPKYPIIIDKSNYGESIFFFLFQIILKKSSFLGGNLIGKSNKKVLRKLIKSVLCD